ncbi:LLM class flavin-dependent oxidoreductase [Winogradskya humida]|uniref:N5,N10-methylene tetrahydromethanopterin reductase n=1 Tax=Winogradskya humida TaxID=113566 RepID=A0ABQ3ZXX0_9ACTN|nr:LLM class flavin-dependent oxidoreductase [Actinoplanes humidus]GIE23273.1 N5,N10-methylene tetrahydromethanopterin reductase [Actinoplanes humidus]
MYARPATIIGVDIGVLLPTSSTRSDPRDLITFGRAAERLGFSSLFVNDSLLSPRVEALTMLAALAPVTTTATLGTGALLPFLRRPLQVAQSLASIDLLSGGRLTVAVGAGFPGRFGKPQYELSEVPWARRFARLDETVGLWRALWAGAGSFHGEFFRHDDLPPATRPFRAGGPPIWLGGATPAALARAGRLYDGWLPYPPDPDDYASGLAQVHKAAADNGRATEAITPALFVTVLIDEDADRGRSTMEKYATATYGVPLADLEKIQAVVTGSADQVRAALDRYAGAGARHIVFRLGALDLRSQRDQLERVAAAVVSLGP